MGLFKLMLAVYMLKLLCTAAGQLTILPESSTLNINHLYCSNKQQISICNMHPLQLWLQDCCSAAATNAGGVADTVGHLQDTLIHSPSYQAPAQQALGDSNNLAWHMQHVWHLLACLILTALRVFMCMKRLTHDSSMAMPDMDFCSRTEKNHNIGDTLHRHQCGMLFYCSIPDVNRA